MTLGTNLIANPDFSKPTVGHNTISKTWGSVQSWSCNIGCQIINVPLICQDYSQFCNVNGTQAINITATSSSINNVSQSLSLTTSTDYLLIIQCVTSSNFYIPNISIYANSTLIDSFYIDSNSSGNSIMSYAQTFSLNIGNLDLSIVMQASNLVGTV
jgi:hypothetical protein